MDENKSIDFQTLSRKIGFISMFLVEYALDPSSTDWVPMGAVIKDLQLRPDFDYYSSHMVLWIREICVAANLTREDRALSTGSQDLEEGYFGITKKDGSKLIR